jgi:membrane protease YdiL (CAAX protease family)
MKHKGLIAYLVIVALLCTGLIVPLRLLGQRGYFLAQFYMLTPAVAALLTRLFFYEGRFKDANLRFGKFRDYMKFWGLALGVTGLSFLIYTATGAVTWDFTGDTFLAQLGKQMAETGQDINALPQGMTPKMMLWLFCVGGLTVFNIMPGLITGFGEEFGWRGFMFPRLYEMRPWAGFVVGGLIWFGWHAPLIFVFPQAQSFTPLQQAVNIASAAAGSVFAFAFFAYVYVKTENIFVASLAHIVMNNAGRSFSFFCTVTDQTLANAMLAVTMGIVVAVLYFMKEFDVFKAYFEKRKAAAPAA